MSYRIHDKGLSTPMPKLPMRTRSLRWTTMDSSEKTLAFALVELDRMACALKRDYRSIKNAFEENKKVVSFSFKKTGHKNCAG